MNKTIKIPRKDNKNILGFEDEYNPNPEECIEIVEMLRQEAMALLYENTDTFQRTVNVIRTKKDQNMIDVKKLEDKVRQ